MREGTKSRPGRPSPSMVVAVIALILALSGTAVAFQALGKNSVGTRQLRSKAVTTGKIANNAVNGAKVANRSLSSADIKFSSSDVVPGADNANHALSADSLSGGHAAACPAGTTLIRGTCFDSSSNPPLGSVTAAADACAAKGGYLPSVLELYATRSVLNLGTGVGDDHQYTDSYYSKPGEGNYRTLAVDGTGAIYELEVNAPSRYICAYDLLQ
jgi:hypothetical protein